MDAVLEPAQSPAKPPYDYRKPRQKRINKGLAGVLAANTDQTWDEIAPQVGAKNGNSLKVSMLGNGLSKRVLQGIAENKVKATLTAQVVSDASEIIRNRLNDELMVQTDLLSKEKPDYSDLASRGQGRAATVKAIAETWRTLNGNPDSVTIQFGASLLSDAQPSTPQPVVDCVSSPVETDMTGTPPVQP